MRTFWRVMCFTAMLFSGGRLAMAQDMPLSQVLIEGQDWELVGRGVQVHRRPGGRCRGECVLHRYSQQPHLQNRPSGQGQRVRRGHCPHERFDVRAGREACMAAGWATNKSWPTTEDGTFQVVVKDADSNDLVVASDGGIYFTDPPHQRVWYVSPDRQKKQIVAEGFRPNGVILTPDEGTLVVTDSDAPHLWAFRVEKDGTLRFGERYFQPLRLPSGDAARPGSDGMTVDKAGRVYVATRAGVQMFDPTGRMGGVILKPQPGSLSNVAFGGADLKMLYATCGDKVFRRRTKTEGVRYFEKAR